VNDAWNFSPIDSLYQVVYFKLNEKGAEIASLAVRVVFEAGDEPPKPREFIFDKPFLIYLEKEGRNQPYFAAWVANAGLLESPSVKKASVSIPGKWNGTCRDSDLELEFIEDGTLTFTHVDRRRGIRGKTEIGEWTLSDGNKLEIIINNFTNTEQKELPSLKILATLQEDMLEGTITETKYAYTMPFLAQKAKSEPVKTKSTSESVE
jgi:hypothetical protein